MCGTVRAGSEEGARILESGASPGQRWSGESLLLIQKVPVRE